MPTPLGDVFVRIGAQTKDFEKSMKGIQSLSSKVFAGITAAAGAMAASKAFTAFATQQKAESDAVRAFGEGAREIISLAGQLQGVTVFGDEATIASAVMLRNMGLLSGEVKRLLPLVQDLATVSGRDLAGASKALGNAINSGSLEPLKELGVAFDESTRKAFKMADASDRAAMAAELLQGVVGGAASELSNADKSMTQFRNAAGDVLETIGGLIDKPARMFFNELTNAANSLNNALKDLPGTLSAAIDWLFEGDRAIVTVVGSIGLIIPALASVGKAIAVTAASFGSALLPVIVTVGSVVAAVFGVMLAIGTVQKHWDDIWFEMGQTAATVKKWFGEAINDMGAWFADLKKEALKHLQPILDGFEDMKKTILSIPGVQTAVDFWSDKGNELADNIGKSGKEIVEKTQAIIGDLSDAGPEITKAAKDLAGSLGTETKDLLSRAMDAIGFGDVGAKLKEMIEQMAPALTPSGVGAGAGRGTSNISIPQAGADPGAGVEAPAGKAMQAIASAGDAVLGIAQNLLGKMGKLGELIQAGIQGFQMGGPIGAIIAVILEIFMSLESVIKFFSQIGDLIGSFFDALSPGFEWLNVLMDAISEALSGFFDIIKTIGSVISDTIGGIITMIMNVIGPILEVIFSFIGLILEIAMGFTEMLQAISPLSWALKGLAELAKGFASVMSDIKDWFSDAARDVGQAFDDAVQWINENIFGGKSKEQMEEEERARREFIRGIQRHAELLGASAAAFSDLVNSVKDAATQAIADINARNMFGSGGMIGDLLEQMIGTSGVRVGDFQSVFDSWFSDLMGKGFTLEKAENMILDQIMSMTALDGERDMILKAFEDAMSDLTDSTKDQTKETEKQTDAIKEATESIMNLPSGFKIARARLEAIEGVTGSSVVGGVTTKGMTGASGGDNVAIENMTVYANNPVEFSEEMNRQKEFNNVANTGTTIPTNADPRLA